MRILCIWLPDDKLDCFDHLCIDSGLDLNNFVIG